MGDRWGRAIGGKVSGRIVGEGDWGIGGGSD